MNNNKPIIIISAVILILIVIVVYMFSSGGEGNDDFSDEFMTNNTEEKFTYDDMMQQNNGNYFDGSEPGDNDELVDLDLSNSAIDGMIDTGDNYYSNEEDDIIKEIEAEIANENRGSRQKKQNSYRDYSDQNYTQKRRTQKKEKDTDDGLGDRVDVNELNNFNGNGTGSFSSHLKVKIFEDKKVSTGSVIKLITTKEIIQNGIKIPANTILTGIVDIEQNRVKITVNSIRTSSGPVSCNLKAYDLNGNEGLLTTNKQIEKEAVNDASNGGGTIIKTPIGDIGKDIFQKKLNANTVSLKMHTSLVLK